MPRRSGIILHLAVLVEVSYLLLKKIKEELPICDTKQEPSSCSSRYWIKQTYWFYRRRRFVQEKLSRRKTFRLFRHLYFLIVYKYLDPTNKVLCYLQGVLEARQIVISKNRRWQWLPFLSCLHNEDIRYIWCVEWTVLLTRDFFDKCRLDF